MDTKNLFREILDKLDEGREALEKAYKRRDMYHNLFLEGYDSGRREAILECIKAVEVVIGDRIHDLATCDKNDDCSTLVYGADLVGDDVLTALRAILSKESSFDINEQKNGSE